MPRKIRELVRELKKSGWYLDRQKGSHRVFKHLKSAEHVSLSGADGDDAKNYEEKNVGRAIERAENQVTVIPCSCRGPTRIRLSLVTVQCSSWEVYATTRIG